jgi:hypothetical protein
MVRGSSRRRGIRVVAGLTVAWGWVMVMVIQVVVAVWVHGVVKRGECPVEVDRLVRGCDRGCVMAR